MAEKDVWRVIPFQMADAAENMAVDEAILRARADDLVPNTIRFYRWDPSTASIGRNQSLSLEIDTEAARNHGVDVIRRISGGGAVYHDKENEITYAVIASEKDIRNIFKFLLEKDAEECEDEDLKQRITQKFFDVDSSYHVITRGLVNGLKYMGVEVDQGVIHCPALFINNRKISGNAQARRNNIILQHGTVLLKIDPDFMYTILKAPEGVTKGKMVRSVKAKVTGVFENIEPLPDLEFVRKMVKGFEEALNIKCEMGELIDKEKEIIADIKKTRYSNDNWLKKIP